MSDPGHIELERTVDSIIVGTRHRTDLGNLDRLMHSIQRVGLLQPITIAPDGTLLCGRRRLEAIRRLGWKKVRVWVRSGISDDLNSLLALRDENTLHKPFSPTEAAELYRELKQVLREDAARRQRATRFVQHAAGTGAEDHGGVESTPPSPTGKARTQAALMVTGTDSHERLDRIGRMQDLAGDPQVPATVRQVAAEALASIDHGAPVSSTWQRVEEARRAATAPASDDDLDALAREALARVKQPRSRRTTTPGTRSNWSLRSFVLTWTDLDGWWTHYDAAEVGTSLKESDWARFEQILRETNRFAAAARRARDHRTRPATA